MARRGGTPTLLLPLLALLLPLSFASTALAASPPSSKPRALVAPITKDPLTSLYTIPLHKNSPFLLDLAGPLVWSACPAHHPTVPCGASSCAAARTFPSPLCPRADRAPHPCTCRATAVNPVTRRCGVADLTLANVTISTTDGRNPTGEVTVPGFTSACVSPDVLKSLPAGAVGVAGLSRSDLGLPSQLSSRLPIKRQFAVCLPGTDRAPGVAFFGDKPFHLLPPTLVEATSLLAYTALKRSRTNPGYYLPLRGIAVNGQAVGFPRRALELDPLGSHGGARLSTAAPYTAMRSDVYRPFLKAYAEATAGIPRAEKVAPFDLCLNSSALGVTRVGYAVPWVDLMLEGGKNWTVFGANSFKQVGDETACLAFVEERMDQEAAAVVVGGFQMEHNFLLFDVARSTLGFSSSLFFFRTTCANFNFTAAA